jgi:hypothetical protein
VARDKGLGALIPDQGLDIAKGSDTFFQLLVFRVIWGKVNTGIVGGGVNLGDGDFADPFCFRG